MIRLAIPILAAAALAGCASDETATPRADGQKCFWANNVQSFAAQGDDVVNLRVGMRDYYRLELMGPCPDVDWATRIALDSRGSSSICTGLDATIIAPSPTGPQRCPVRTVRKLTAEEVKALPKGAKP